MEGIATALCSKMLQQSVKNVPFSLLYSGHIKLVQGHPVSNVCQFYSEQLRTDVEKYNGRDVFHLFKDERHEDRFSKEF